MIRKRLKKKTNSSDDDSEKDDNELLVRSTLSRQKRPGKSILTKVINRSSTGYFNFSISNKSHQKLFNPNHVLQFCLKDVIPYRYLDQIFMGLSACGNFLISYKRISCESETSYDFNSGNKFELFFWIYRPYMPLSKYVRKLFCVLAKVIKNLISVHREPL